MATTCPVADLQVDVRDRLAPNLRLAVLSNSTPPAWPEVRRGLALLDERHMKLDARDPITYADVNGLGTSIRAVVDAVRGLPRVGPPADR